MTFSCTDVNGNNAERLLRRKCQFIKTFRVDAATIMYTYYTDTDALGGLLQLLSYRYGYVE